MPSSAEVEVDNSEELDPQLEESSDSANGMADFYQLRNNLLIIVAASSAVIFVAVFFTYGLNTALNYLLGAIVGLVYIRMLAKDVERVGVGSSRFSKARLAVLVGVVAIASKLENLEILPIFFGFLSYKFALILYTLRAIVNPDV
ncbi:MAG: ATP synthase subunit I [Cyanobacteria bacterium P01_F01_bin.153]